MNVTLERATILKQWGIDNLQGKIFHSPRVKGDIYIGRIEIIKSPQGDGFDVIVCYGGKWDQSLAESIDTFVPNLDAKLKLP